MATFYATIVGVCLVLPIPEATPLRIGAGVAIAVVAVAASTASYADWPLTDPIENVRNAGSTLADVVVPGGFDDEIEAGMAAVRSGDSLDPGILAAVDGHSVHVDPAETAVAWAYGLDWDPLPAFQPYIAETPELDDLNADALASADGPERILREPTNPLGRYPGWDPPAAMIAMLCNYAPEVTTDRWQLLERIPGRCGRARSIGRVEATTGAPITVPRAGRNSIVYGVVDGLGVTGAERLESLLYRAKPRRVSFDGGAQFVVVPQTAGDGLLLRAPRGIDYPGAFALAPDPAELTFAVGDEAGRPLDVEFFAIPVSR